ncbi:response regulator [Paenibacillus doosanensis]|uniref:response regulator n=1 Tax=Paenibacillus doosanensis TaxID=1229154 RepID=UPI00217FB602|nr:response regulator [Paenibacillus doosanensis]MCS7460312.1 response regulator [Paenibacillus doosanensis]
MYRVAIVDDEPWVLKGIRNTFRWDDYGFEVAMETTDSQEAWEYIRQERPDAVVTDIRMPEISGMDLMRKSREEGIGSEFIIISGAADFHYAQESLRLGCFDYLLKPLQFEEADAVLKRLHEQLEAAQRQKDKDVMEALYKGEEARIEELLSARGFRRQGKPLQALWMESASEARLAEAEGWLEGTGHIAFRADPGRTVILAADASCIHSALEARWQVADATGLFIGVSRPSPGDRGIAEAIEEARSALQSSFLFPEGGVFLFRKESLPELRKRVYELCSALQQPAGEYPIPQYESFPELFRKKKAGIKDVIYFWNQIVSALHKPFGESSLREELQFMDYEELTARFADFEQLCAYLKQLAVPAAEASGADANFAVNENFGLLLEYVDSHYMEELHLKELSHRFYINYTYCCDLFQKTTKSTFTDYMTRLRMKKAELLLRERSHSIHEVCEKVGYKDYAYFNKVFKKWYGLTPSNYRKLKATY